MGAIVVGVVGTAVVVVGGLVGGTSAPPLLITLTVVSSAFSVVVGVSRKMVYFLSFYLTDQLPSETPKPVSRVVPSTVFLVVGGSGYKALLKEL